MMTLTKAHNRMIAGSVVNVLDYGADSTGTSDATAAINAAYAVAIAGGGELFFPAGTYLCNVTFNGGAPVRGAGRYKTVLKPFNTSSYCVRIFGAGGGTFSNEYEFGASVSSLSIVNDTVAGSGLQLGELGNSSGCSNVSIEDIHIQGFTYNLRLERAIMCSFKDMDILEGEYGIWADSEDNVTTLHFDTVRSRSNDYGMYLQTGLLLTFTNCNFESNGFKNMWFRSSITQGPSRVTFDGCWFEALTEASGVRYNIHLDMQDNTKQYGILFNRCVISTNAGLVDVYAEQANGVIFDRCSFSVTDSFDTTRLQYSAGSNATKVKLIECGTIQDSPVPAMYTSFPALTRVSGGTFGFFYDFTEIGGKRHTNFAVLTVSADLTSQQVSYVETLNVDTTGGTININSLTGGSAGQKISIIKPVAANTISVKNNGTGTQKIFTSTGSDVSLSGNQGMTLVCDGTNWYQT